MRRRPIPVRVETTVVTPLVLPDGYGRMRVRSSSGLCIEYNVTAIRDTGRIVGFMVIKNGRDQYAVNILELPWMCDCADFEYRRRHADVMGCKHIAGLRQFIELLGIGRAVGIEEVEPVDACVFRPEE